MLLIVKCRNASKCCCFFLPLYIYLRVITPVNILCLYVQHSFYYEYAMEIYFLSTLVQHLS